MCVSPERRKAARVGVRDTCRRRQTVMTAWWNTLKAMRLSSMKMALSLENIPAPVRETETLLHKATPKHGEQAQKTWCQLVPEKPHLYLKHCWAWMDDQNGQKEVMCHWPHHAAVQPELWQRHYITSQKYGHKMWVLNSQQWWVYLLKTFSSEYFIDYCLHCTLTITYYMEKAFTAFV